MLGMRGVWDCMGHLPMLIFYTIYRNLPQCVTFLKLKFEEARLPEWDLHFASVCILEPLIQAKNIQ